MTPPHGPHLVYPPFPTFDVEMTSEVPTPPLIIVDNDVVEALKVELAKCKSNRERELELVHMEHVNKVQGLPTGM